MAAAEAEAEAAPARRPRPYQEECLRRVLGANTIVSLPTGTGKTHVAVLAVDHFRERGPGRALFAVPTRVLVAQQAGYFRQHCQSRPRVAELCGNEMEGWTRDKWRHCLRDHDVLVGTPEVFRRAMVDAGHVSAKDFSLLILDECHNATGNSPMASIMRDAVWPLAISAECPRVLGLTASFVHGKLRNVEQKRQQLETLLQSSLFCPEVPQEFCAERAVTGGAGAPVVAGPKFTHVKFRDDQLVDSRPLVEKRLGALLSQFEAFEFPIKDVDKVVSRTCHVLEELGMAAFLFALREGVIPQLEAHAEELKKLPQPASKEHASHLCALLPRLRAHLQQAADELSRDGQLTKLPYVSGKAEALLELVGRLFERKGRLDPGYRGIIFVTQVSLTFPLAHLLNHHFADNNLVKAGAVSGVGSMAEASRTREMDRFRQGQTTVMVCTNALEEGVDISDCAFVIRLTRFDTTRSHIQGSGRARRADAEVFYFDNDPDQEELGALHMAAVARDASLGLSQAQRLERRDEATREVPGVYPFRTGSGAEVNFFNCLQIVYEYCQRTMQQSFDPQQLYSYTEEEVCQYPRQVRRSLSMFSYPSPAGMRCVTLQEVNEHWGSIALEEVVDPDRCCNMDAQDKERRRLLYVVAADMHRQGFLDADNRPSPRALSATKLACPAFTMEPCINIKNTFVRDALARDVPPAHAGAGLGGGDRGPWGGGLGGDGGQAPGDAGAGLGGGDRGPWGGGLGGDGGQTPGGAGSGAAQPPDRPPSMSALPVPAAAAVVTVADMLTPGAAVMASGGAIRNFKGLLNEWAMKRQGQPGTWVKYDSVSCSGGFRSTATVTFMGRSFIGEVRPSKKTAEQSAAERAVNELGCS